MRPIQGRYRQPAPARADDLRIAGLTRLSTVDWPGKLVATAFLQGCPWRCGYCQNHDILDPRAAGTVPWSDVRALLAKRHGLLDGIVFSGGEPTMQPALLPAIREAKDAGYLVGLHTCGGYPRRLAQALPFVDWVGLDIKAPLSDAGDDSYARITTVAASRSKAAESLRLLLSSGVDHQLRTTVDPTVLTRDSVRRLVDDVAAAGGEALVLQTVRSLGTPEGYPQLLRDAGGPIRAPELAAEIAGPGACPLAVTGI